MLKSILGGLSLLSLMIIISCSEDPIDVPEFGASVSVSTSSTRFAESVGMVTVAVTINAENTSGGTLSIPLGYSGTATSGTDYQSATSVAIASGTNEATLTINVTDDESEEEDETIIITIDADALPTGVTLGTGTLTLTIEDNDEEDDGGGTGTCDNGSNGDSIDQDNRDCTENAFTKEYTENFNDAGSRIVTTKGLPSHDWGNQIPNLVSELDQSEKTWNVPTQPSLASSVTSVLQSNNRPMWVFGVALNGVKIDPAPGEPFIFEDQSTGEYNWDWVFEPNNNMQAVGLDCAIAHVQPNGEYHYHGDFAPFADQVLDGLGSGTATPTTSDEAFVGWAGDGFPILYKFGPNAAGTMVALSSSYQLKSGERPGDGDSAPCGTYNGKYTNDYEFVSGAGDLDECNGIANSVTLTTEASGGTETFDYFYVITEAFPVISRCFSGTPDDSFTLGPP